jgi:hypothetical protein
LAVVWFTTRAAIHADPFHYVASPRNDQAGHEVQAIGPAVFVEIETPPEYFVVNQRLMRARLARRLSQKSSEQLVLCGKAVKISRLMGEVISDSSTQPRAVSDVLEGIAR